MRDALKWERPYNVVIRWVRACLSFTILQATLLCVQGSHTRPVACLLVARLFCLFSVNVV